MAGAARRVHKMMPHARMLSLLRHPVDRHLSHIDTKFGAQLNGNGGGRGSKAKITADVYRACVDYVAKTWGFPQSGEGSG